MRRLCRQADFRQILQLTALIGLLTGRAGIAQEKFPNELNSPIDEPVVVLPENPLRVPIRPASAAVLASSDPLVKLVYETREVQRQRLLSTSEHTPWQMMHGLLGLRQDFLINHDGQTINGLEWIQTGPMFRNEPWFEKTQFGGRAHPYNKPYWFEGHINQSLAILATCNVPLDTQFGTPAGPITMRDMLRNAQMTTNEKEEVTWTLWALSTYLPSDAEWVNARGERWSIERLVQIEVGKQVGGPTSPCGGTHGLFALARARNVYLRTGKPLRGVWLQADQKIQKYIQTARHLQNPNGTLSSNFFRGREYKQDFDKRMASSGHVLEFLMMALPQERLKEQWLRRAVEATANDLMANRKAYVSCSPLYHATNALTIYLERVLPAGQPAVAQNPVNTTTISSAKEKKLPEPPAATMSPSTAAIAAGPASAQPAQGAGTAGLNGKAPAAAASVPSLPEASTAAAPATVAPSASATATEIPSKTTISTPASDKDPGTASEIVIPMPMPVSSDSEGGPLIQIPLPDAAVVPAVVPSPSASAPSSGVETSPGSEIKEPAVPSADAAPAAGAVPSVPEPVSSPDSPATASGVPALSPVPLTEESGELPSETPLPTPELMPIPAGAPIPVPMPEAVSAVQPSLAAEQHHDRTTSAPPVPVQVKPVPLQRTPAILFVPGAAKMAPLSRPILQSSSPTKVMPAETSVQKISLPAIDKLQLVPSQSEQKNPADPEQNSPRPEPRKSAEWKSTPAERRKQIVFDEPVRI